MEINEDGRKFIELCKDGFIFFVIKKEPLSSNLNSKWKSKKVKKRSFSKSIQTNGGF